MDVPTHETINGIRQFVLSPIVIGLTAGIGCYLGLSGFTAMIRDIQALDFRDALGLRNYGVIMPKKEIIDEVKSVNWRGIGNALLFLGGVATTALTSDPAYQIAASTVAGFVATDYVLSRRK